MISRAVRVPSLIHEPLPPSVRIVRSAGELDELAATWDGLLAEGAGFPMLSHAWMRACTAAFAGHGQLEVTVVENGHGAAVAPLIIRRGAIPRLELLGVEETGEPSDLMAGDPSALALLAEALVRTRRPLFLKRIPAESPAVAALQRAYGGKGVVIARPHAGYPWVPLDATWSCPESRLNAGRRSDLRRVRRIAEGLGPVTIEVVSPSPAELPNLLEEAFCVEAASWKSRRGSAVLDDAARRMFYSRYALSAARQGILRLGFLRIGGRAAAMQIAVESAGRFWLLKMGYDETFARCSPGTLLMIETLRYAATRGLSSYEFLGAVEPWTLMWTRLVRPCVSLRAYPATAQGVTALLVDAVKFGARKVAGLARLDHESNGAASDDKNPAGHPQEVLDAAR
jgi:CelD/BcsL family acetyltransferase involved in cellulose biosynthesis